MRTWKMWCFRYLGVDIAMNGTVGAEVYHRVDKWASRGCTEECVEREVNVFIGKDGFA